MPESTTGIWTKIAILLLIFPPSKFVLIISQWARKFKIVQAKKLVKSNKSFFREIAFLAVLNFFPVQKLSFGHF